MSGRFFRKICVATTALIALSGGTMLMTGCRAIAIAAIAGGAAAAVVVLAKYHASNQQKAVAEETARKTFIQAAKPDYERRRAAAQAEARKKIADIEGTYGKRIAQAPRSKPAAGSPGASAAEIEAEKKKALAKAQADSAAELAALDRGWHSLGGTPSHGLEMAAEPSGAGGVPLASTRDREALA